MKKNILFVLLLLFIPLAQAVPPVTSYWGTVTLDGLTIPNAAVTVVDSSGNTVATATTDSSSRYSVVVPWADSYTSSVSLTFKVNGYIATTATIGAQGDDINLNLAASSSSGGSSGGGGGGSSSGGTYPSGYSNTGGAAQATTVQTSTATPVGGKTEVPTTTATPVVTETTTATTKPTSAPSTPAFEAIIAVFAIAMIASVLKNNRYRR
ncbi:MAG: carboxypeptidase-like regulatory domain-containing protein [Candidatus Methanoperedens sp.]|nr:carboxypeptidase-like regulatory domain-containing protein [Candidatus Methanoperedens sp.]